jgi:arabinose-5-phosphate isomerase
MGKSGHVARKIAATFASTGQASFFVHPAEASHGDLGMIGRDDAVLALSNSGETPELRDIIAYTRRFAIPLIGMTRGPSSSLAKRSDYPLVLPASPEACPNAQAPTTSTTAMLALGDALAVALMARRGFSADDFRQFHPGGKLGQKLLSARDVMHTGARLPLVNEEQLMSDVLPVMSEKRFGCTGVVNAEGVLVGIITDGDLRRHMGDGLIQRRAAEIMSKDPAVVTPDRSAVRVLDLMNGGNPKKVDITSLFVVEDGRPVGLVHIHDCLRQGVA